MADISSTLANAVTGLYNNYSTKGKGITNILMDKAYPTLPVAFNSLMEVLASRGATDPRLLNSQISNIDRRTQANQNAARGRLAAAGLTGSLGGQALEAAIGESGTRQVSDLLAQEAKLQEDRQRSDIALALQGLLGPVLENKRIEWGAAEADKNRRNQPNQYLSALGSVASIAAMAFGICWVARAIYGDDSDSWLLARHYLLNIGPNSLLAEYADHGPELAEYVKADPVLREQLRPVFDYMVETAKQDLGV